MTSCDPGIDTYTCESFLSALATPHIKATRQVEDSSTMQSQRGLLMEGEHESELILIFVLLEPCKTFPYNIKDDDTLRRALIQGREFGADDIIVFITQS